MLHPRGRFGTHGPDALPRPADERGAGLARVPRWCAAPWPVCRSRSPGCPPSPGTETRAIPDDGQALTIEHGEREVAGIALAVVARHTRARP
ncbi:MAG TPA: hypothetical protein VF310_02660 [Vicinamibacteria bacterium]